MRVSKEAGEIGTDITQPGEHSRRDFLLRVGGVVAGTAILGTATYAHAGSKNKQAPAGPLSPADRKARKKAAYALRRQAAMNQYHAPDVPLSVNGDEALYPNGIGTFSKSLPHDANGLVDPAALQSLIGACQEGSVYAFEHIPAGGTMQLKNPMAAYAFTLEGADSHNVYMPPPPAIASAEQAAEAAELYWQALLRDVPFSQYPTHPLVQQACSDLNRFSDFRGPRIAGAVTPQTLFRGTTVGELKGPWLSQFLLKDMVMGHTPVAQKYLCAEPGTDYIQTWDEWLSLQRGTMPDLNVPLLPERRYLQSGRDIAHHVHLDFPYQSPMVAALSMLHMKIPASYASPYYTMPRECAFGTFGEPDLMVNIAKVSALAIQAAWRHKWTLHRRTRPEEFAGRVHRRMTTTFDFPAHSELLTSDAMQAIFAKTGAYLLPLTFPEGAPAHPSFPSGHATFLGACVTVLKAYFEEAYAVPDPVMPREDGLSLVPYQGPPLTVGAELNKLASNVALARNFGGLHWRSDAMEGMRLGERVAIGLLTETKPCYPEQFLIRFTSFDGAAITI